MSSKLKGTNKILIIKMLFGDDTSYLIISEEIWDSKYRKDSKDGRDYDKWN